MAEEKEEKKKERRPKMIAVKIVEEKGKSALVEWQAEGDLCRAYVPVSKTEGGKCDEDTLGIAIPYGVPWEDLIGPVTTETVGKELRRRGIWTSADIEKNMQGVRRAISEATGLTPASLHTLVKRYETEEV